MDLPTALPSYFVSCATTRPNLPNIELGELGLFKSLKIYLPRVLTGFVIFMKARPTGLRP